MKDDSLIFYGINIAIWKIPSILNLGILSEKAAANKNMILGFNFGYQSPGGMFHGHNDKTSISCARSPVHIDAIGDEHGAFGLYIKDNISFVIKGVTAGIKSKSGIPGKALENYEIPSDNIIGLMVPDALVTKKIHEINFLKGGTLNTFHLRCQDLLKFVKEKSGIEDPDLLLKVSIPTNTDEERNQLEAICNKLLQKFISPKLDIDSGSLIDLLRILVPSKLKLYNSKGFEI